MLTSQEYNTLSCGDRYNIYKELVTENETLATEKLFLSSQIDKLSKQLSLQRIDGKLSASPVSDVSAAVNGDAPAPSTHVQNKVILRRVRVPSILGMF